LRLDTRAFYDTREVTITNAGIVSPVVSFSDLDRAAGGVGYTLTYSDLDNNRNPRNGYFAQISQDFGGIGSDNEFLRTEVQAVAVKEFAEKYVGYINLKAGHMTGLGNGDPQIFDSFFKGSNLVRGFADRGIGPRYITGANNDAIGGLMYVGATAEVRFPLPLIPEDFGLSGAVFADAGTLMNVGDISGLSAGQRANIYEDDAIRSSIGLGVIWVSPFGPIRADYGFVTSEGRYDDKQAFRFGSATRF
jgi:outer membrane protein insertion porin family